MSAEPISLEPTGSEPLGMPLPRDEHACSVSLPSWAAVVGYEEGDETITKAMRCGYPRFVYHPLILKLMAAVVEQHGQEKEDCLLLPGYAAAVRCQAFLKQALTGRNNTRETDNALLCLEGFHPTHSVDHDTLSSNIRIVKVGAANVHAVLFPAETLAGMQAKAYWQHTGEIVSSRRAEEALIQLGIPVERTVTCGPHAPYICHPAACDETQPSSKTTPSNMESPTFSALRQRIAEWTQVPNQESVFLTPSGMCSIYTAMRSARRYHLLNNYSHHQPHPHQGGRSIVYGFPYLDTLKLCSRREFCPDGVDFFGMGNANDLQLLEQVLQSKQNQHHHKISALFTEVPSNPLLQCPDLNALRKLADEYDFALIVDDTIGNFLNIDMISTGLADAVCTSLTKIVSGRGDAMAGSIVVNPNTEKGRWMQQDLQREYYSSKGDTSTTHPNDTARGLFQADANAILSNSRDFVQRNQKINQTSEQLADWLVGHNDVEKVWYPKYSPLYPVLFPNAGYGGLMSILLDSHMCQRTFYDSLNVAKGPSLGTNFTLVCPYTLLAHYHELDFAMSYNVPPNLLRISVGLEDADRLKARFEEAFSKSRLYPKLHSSAAVPKAQSRAYTTSAMTLDSPTLGGRIPLRQCKGLYRPSMQTVKSMLRRLPR
jgi:cystathionine gamma-synthase